MALKRRALNDIEADIEAYKKQNENLSREIENLTTELESNAGERQNFSEFTARESQNRQEMEMELAVSKAIRKQKETLKQLEDMRQRERSKNFPFISK